MNKLAICFSLIGLIAFNSCRNNAKGEAEGDHDSNEEHKHWSYQGETSPEHWAEIEKESDCSGTKQSPINIIDSLTVVDKSNINKLELLYSPVTELSHALNNGHSIEFDFENGDSIKYMNDIYHLKQIHFHAPAEHTVNGIRPPIELHLVHLNKENEYAVLSIFGKEDVERDFNEFLSFFLPLKKDEIKEFHKSLDLTTLFPANADQYYDYDGSLTTPPCTEKVNWVIFKERISISEDAILLLKNNMPLNNYRDVQKLNGRKIRLVSNK